MSQTITLIYARAANGIIGKDNKLPWHIPADLKRFKALTMGKPIIMGRKTFDSFASLLPGRRHIVLTRDPKWQAEHAEVAHSVAQAIEIADASDVWVIGGAEIYALFMPVANRVEITEVHADYEGDTFMPAIDEAEWTEIAREDHPASDTKPAFSFITYTRKEDA